MSNTVKFTRVSAGRYVRPNGDTTLHIEREPGTDYLPWELSVYRGCQVVFVSYYQTLNEAKAEAADYIGFNALVPGSWDSPAPTFR